MRPLLLVVVLAGHAFAQSAGPPHGTYSLGQDPRERRWTVNGEELPSCGAEALKLLAGYRGLSIFHRGKIWIGKQEWIDHGVSTVGGVAARWARQPDSSKDTLIATAFWRTKTGGAEAWLLFWRLDEQHRPICHDGLVFSGRFTP